MELKATDFNNGKIKEQTIIVHNSRGRGHMESVLYKRHTQGVYQVYVGGVSVMVNGIKEVREVSKRLPGLMGTFRADNIRELHKGTVGVIAELKKEGVIS